MGGGGGGAARYAEVAFCDVGGEAAGSWGVSPLKAMLQTRCIWSLATAYPLIHDNHVHHCAVHALDLDA
jgi:hypothetical protein